MTQAILYRPFPWIDPANGANETLSRTRDGYSGERCALVVANNAGDAINAVGMPRLGDSWSAQVPGAVVAEIGPAERIAWDGPDNAAAWRVPVRYTQRTFGTITPDGRTFRRPGDAVTEWVTGLTTTTVYMPRRALQFGGTLERFNANPDGSIDFGNITGVPQTPIDNGNGTSISIGVLGARVSVWYAIDDEPPINEFVRLMRPNHLNDTPIRLPPMEGATRTTTIRDFQCLYQGFDQRVEATGEPDDDGVSTPLVRVTHTLSIAENHYVVWQARDASGAALDAYYADFVYPRRVYGQLWPGI